jgi:hypothetical protein
LRVNALAQKDVGDYLNKYFVASYQKISTFTLAQGGQKQGGNVASYFCTPDGRVLHAVAGPVSGAKLLEEARWAEEMWKLVELRDLRTFMQHQTLFRKVHLERLAAQHGLHWSAKQLPPLESLSATAPIGGPKVEAWLNRSGDTQGKVHLLLAAYPLPKLGRVYETVFRSILNQELSTAPVVQNSRE